MLIADQGPFKVLATTGGVPIVLGDVFSALAVDGSNRIYAAFLKGEVKVIAPDGTGLPPLTPHDDSIAFLRGLEFGPFDSVWRGHLFASTDSGEIYRIEENGNLKLFGSGFGQGVHRDLAFGPDGALYISSNKDNVIYRITPADKTLPLCYGKVATIVGTEGSDNLIGTDGPDVIQGLGGHDVIGAKGGDDIICGGDGNDSIFEGTGDDIILGEEGHDVIWAGSGHDILRGGNGDDFLWGRSGNDELWGNYGNDTLKRGRGVDELYGGWGPDAGTMDNNDTCYDERWTIQLGL